MAIEGFVKFEYYSKGVPPYYNKTVFPELLDDESIVIQTPNLEMNYHQYYALFKKFLMSVGFSEKNIIQGACNIAFNEMNDEATMKEVADEYDLIMAENLPEIIENQTKTESKYTETDLEKKVKELEGRCSIWEERYWSVYNKLKTFCDGENYTEEELNAMCEEAELNSSWAEKVKEGYDYWEDTSNSDMWNQGILKVSTNEPMKAWNGLIPGSPEARKAGCICPVLDNEEMPDDKKWIDVNCPIHGKAN